MNLPHLSHHTLLDNTQYIATIIEQRVDHLQHMPEVLFIQIVDRGTGQGLRKIAGAAQPAASECTQVLQSGIGIEEQDRGFGGVRLKCNEVRHE
ncbi:hypothetical protein SAMN05216598_1536 [Pseudomonas asplenii]|uniref:Uncharacterized protein n=1 Tax=Pseudomonas asplenii TaxID=53407 RepID=A0A1H1S1Z7_9PSED|nr:hypothetical protein [Pseudomonas asplenii]SDS42002.1 hypothetical protein SAMN05216598_1536 [Pseudomonas asplenii]